MVRILTDDNKLSGDTDVVSIAGGGTTQSESGGKVSVTVPGSSVAQLAPLAQPGQSPPQEPVGGGSVASVGTLAIAARADHVHPASGSSGDSIYSFKSGRYYQAPQITNGAGPNQILTVLNRCYLVPFIVGEAGAVSKIGVGVWGSFASSTCRLGIYEDDGDGTPHSLLADYGSVVTDTNGAEPEASGSAVVSPGKYWIAVAAQGAAGGLFSAFALATVTGSADLDTALRGYQTSWAVDGISGALPNPLPAPSPNGTNVCPSVGVKAA